MSDILPLPKNCRYVPVSDQHNAFFIFEGNGLVYRTYISDGCSIYEQLLKLIQDMELVYMIEWPLQSSPIKICWGTVDIDNDTHLLLTDPHIDHLDDINLIECIIPFIQLGKWTLIGSYGRQHTLLSLTLYHKNRCEYIKSSQLPSTLVVGGLVEVPSGTLEICSLRDRNNSFSKFELPSRIYFSVLTETIFVDLSGYVSQRTITDVYDILYYSSNNIVHKVKIVFE
jgi:hypothetical protein